MLELVNIYGAYEFSNSILNSINFRIERNKTLTILGENGAGKSTIAKVILNLLPLSKGQVLFDGEDISDLNTEAIINSGIGYFMQGGQVFSQLSIADNLKFAGRSLKKNVLQEQSDELSEYFEILNSSGRLQKKKATYLSGGQKNQLAMAMVMINKPKLLILDEPSAGLSEENAVKMYRNLNRLKESQDLTILLIEQNKELAMEFSDDYRILKEKVIK